MTRNPPVVFVVDDDAKLRESLFWLLESANYTVEAFESVADFQEAYHADRPGCLLLDVCMPGTTGLDLQQQLARQPHHPPIVFLTGQGEVEFAVRAMKLGAVDFLEKPFVADQLLNSIDQALKLDDEQRRRRDELAMLRARLEQLSDRQRQVLGMVVEGMQSREIADRLKLSCRTIENCRATILRKMHVESTIELVRLMLALDESPAHA